MNVPSKMMIDQLYATYDGGYLGPSNLPVSPSVLPLTQPVNCDIRVIGDKIPDYIVIGPPTPIPISVGDDIVFPAEPMKTSLDVIGQPVCARKGPEVRVVGECQRAGQLLHPATHARPGSHTARSH
jgi:hypothetical protein